ncbi:MAG: hypothetical protein ACE5Q6_09760 [Dehalococcoidia bacterium]
MNKKWFMVGMGGVAVIAALAVALALALVLPGASSHETGNGTGQLASLASPPTGGPAEGIQVHGHWRIDVLDPDGTLVSSRKFDNAMTPRGKFILTTLLWEGVAGTWGIELDDPSGGNAPCLDGSNNVSFCGITEPLNDQAGEGNPQYHNNLDVGRLSLSDDEFVLEGFAIADRDGAISDVATHVLICSNNEGSDCKDHLWTFDDDFSDFTSQKLEDPNGNPDPVNLQEDQQVQVTVTITVS